MQAFRNTAAFFDSTRHEVNELFDAGERVVADVNFMTCSRGSETEVVQREAHTWTLAGGVIVRFEWGRDLAAAPRSRRAVGVGDVAGERRGFTLRNTGG
jgi:ketosteroid isomerase-like protein